MKYNGYNGKYTLIKGTLSQIKDYFGNQVYPQNADPQTIRSLASAINRYYKRTQGGRWIQDEVHVPGRDELKDFDGSVRDLSDW